MHEAAFAKAALPAQVMVLRLPLQPFSLGHELILIRRENPFAFLTTEGFNSLSDEQRMDALFEAAEVCSQTWNQNLWLPRGPFQRWAQIRRFKRWVGLVRREAGKAKPAKAGDVGAHSYWEEQIAVFRQYRNDGLKSFPSDLPKGQKAGGTRFLGAPEILSLHQFIIANIPPSQWPNGCAWDFHFGLARMHKECMAERAGDLDIYNYYDWQHDQFVKEQEESRKNQDGKNV